MLGDMACIDGVEGSVREWEALRGINDIIYVARCGDAERLAAGNPPPTRSYFKLSESAPFVGCEIDGRDRQSVKHLESSHENRKRELQVSEGLTLCLWLCHRG